MRLSQLLLPFCMIGLGPLCGLTQVAAMKPVQIFPSYEPMPIDPHTLSPITFAGAYWQIKKDQKTPSSLATYGSTLIQEGYGRNLSPEEIVEQRMSNLATYAAAFENDYIRYFRERHNGLTSTPPQIANSVQLSDFNQKVDDQLVETVSSNILMEFVQHYSKDNDGKINQLLNRMVREMRDRQATTFEKLSPAVKDKIDYTEFRTYCVSRLQSLTDAELKEQIFKSDKILFALVYLFDPQHVYSAFKHAVEPYSGTTSSLSRQW